VSTYKIPFVTCDADHCFAETHHLQARTADDVRRLRKPDGWHTRPGGRDICPDCWAAGHR
jgi:hypothetical protein